VKSIQVKMSLAAALAAATLALAPLAGAMAANPSHAAGAGTLTIGAFAPESGAYAAAGIDIIDSVRLAVQNLNKTGNVLGMKLTVDAQDSPCNPQVAVQAAQKLVNDGVVGVVGPYCSGDAIPASTIYHRAGIPMITPGSSNPKLTEQGFDNIFRTIGRDDEQGAYAARIMVRRFHAKRIALIHDNTVYAKGVATQTQLALQKYAGTSVIFFDAITPNSHDFSSILTRVRSAHPDVTYFTGYYSDGGLLVKQFAQLGVSGQFMAGDANNDPAFIKLAGSYANKAYVTTAPVPQLVASAAGFVSQYRATYHRDPGAYSAYAYDAANTLIHAIQMAHTAALPAVIKQLHQTKNFPGVTGPITYNAKGDRVQVQYITVTVRNGHFVPAFT